MGDNARTRDAHIDDALRLANSMESAGHKGVVFHRIAEDHELGAADGTQLGRLADDQAHLLYGVHVDAGLCGADVYAGADQLGIGQCAGDGADEPQVAFRQAFLAERGKPSDEVYADGFCCPVHKPGKNLIVR